MHTLADYVNATPEERAAENNRRGWTNTPPAVQTHRGKPATPAWARHLLNANGKDAA